ncbi:glycosyltransferase family 2 protein [Flavobacterium faecale]|uniref:glycosyltransferase family 2 protein n=1 Tax=Flavobacterium faecale TaxID=1355330 RepID=UPI003AAF3F4F
MSSSLVSIIMITYGHEKFIQQAVEGVLMQECDFDIELIIADDCSPDSTGEIVTSIIENYPRGAWIKYIKHEKNIGMMPNFIFALQQCQGKYIALCEGDDYWTDPLKLQKQVDFLVANKDYSLCFTRFKTLQQNTNTITEDSNTGYFEEKDLNVEFDFEIFAKGWHVGTQTLVFRKEMFDSDVVHNYKYFRDVHLFTELLKNGKGTCLNFFGAIYRLHDGGIHSSIDYLNTLKIGTLCYKELYCKNNNINALRLKYYNFQNEYFKVLVQKSKFRPAIFNLILFFLKENKSIILKDGLLYLCRNIYTKSKQKMKLFLK